MKANLTNGVKLIPAMRITSIEDKLLNLFLALITVLFAMLALVSLGWRMQVDAPIFHYIVVLMGNFDYMPYRDILDINMPGAYLLHWLIIKIFGYSDLGFRIFDLLWLGALMGVTYRFMRDFSHRVGYAAAILVGLLYLSNGAGWSFERDFVLLLPIALAILAYRSEKISNKVLQCFLIGFFVGAASTLKPHASVAVLAFIPAFSSNDDKKIIQKFGGLFLGLSILPSICFLWIWLNGALPGFWQIISNFTPLYNSLTRNFVHLEGIEKFDEIIFALNNLYPVGILLAPASIGCYIFLNQTQEHKKLVYLLISLFFFSIFYLILPNKLFLYHWIPLEYFNILLVSLCFAKNIQRKRFVYLLTVIVLSLNLLYSASTYILFPVKEELLKEVDVIGDYLKKSLEPQDKVQGIGFIGSVTHSMYIAKAPLATPYLYAMLLMYQQDHPYTQKMRADFLNRLHNSPPRFIVYGLMEFLPQEDDFAKSFPALENFIRSNYRPVLNGQTFIIFERNQI